MNNDTGSSNGQSTEAGELKSLISRASEFTQSQNSLLMVQRALKFSEASVNTQMKNSLIKVITFWIGREKCGLEANFVQEIVPFRGVTRVPGIPEYFLGVINLHGQLVALVDLGLMLCGRSAEKLSSTQIIVIGKEQIDFAIIVDEVDCVDAIDESDLLEAPEFIGRDCIKGLMNCGTTIFNGESLINDARLLVNHAEK